MLIQNNTPSAGYVSWSDFEITHQDVTYTITDGSSNKKYIWWDFSTPTVFLGSNTMPTVTQNDCIVILNDSGTSYLWGDWRIHGELILDNTILAAALDVKLDDLGTPDDNTDLNTSNSAHGLMKKLTDETDKYFDASGNFVQPKLDDLATPDDNTDLNASNAKHGLLLKLTDTANHFLNASGAWAEAVVLAAVQTLTNKRITKRVNTIVSSATPTPNSDTTDIYTITALAEAATFGAPTGTPTQFQPLVIRILDNGTIRALSFNAAYREGEDITLPASTVLSKTMYLGFVWNSAISKWDLIGYTDNI